MGGWVGEMWVGFGFRTQNLVSKFVVSIISDKIILKFRGSECPSPPPPPPNLLTHTSTPTTGTRPAPPQDEGHEGTVAGAVPWYVCCL